MHPALPDCPSLHDTILTVGNGDIRAFTPSLEPVYDFNLNSRDAKSISRTYFNSTAYFDVLQLDEDHFVISSWYGSFHLLVFNLATGALVCCLKGGEDSMNRMGNVFVGGDGRGSHSSPSLSGRQLLVSGCNRSNLYFWEIEEEMTLSTATIREEEEDKETQQHLPVPELSPCCVLECKLRGGNDGARSLDVLHQRNWIIMASDNGAFNAVDVNVLSCLKLPDPEIHNINGAGGRILIGEETGGEWSPRCLFSRASQIPRHGSLYSIAAKEPNIAFLGSYGRKLSMVDVRVMKVVHEIETSTRQSIQGLLHVESPTLENALFCLTSGGFVSRYDIRMLSASKSVYTVQPHGPISNWGAISPLNDSCGVSTMMGRSNGTATWSFGDGKVLNQIDEMGQGVRKMGMEDSLSRCGVVRVDEEEEEERIQFLLEKLVEFDVGVIVSTSSVELRLLCAFGV